MKKELPKVYEPQQVESRIYQMWEDNDCFNGDPDPRKKPFSSFRRKKFPLLVLYCDELRLKEGGFYIVTYKL